MNWYSAIGRSFYLSKPFFLTPIYNILFFVINSINVSSCFLFKSYHLIDPRIVNPAISFVFHSVYLSSHLIALKFMRYLTVSLIVLMQKNSIRFDHWWNLQNDFNYTHKPFCIWIVLFFSHFLFLFLLFFRNFGVHKMIFFVLNEMTRVANFIDIFNNAKSFNFSFNGM